MSTGIEKLQRDLAILEEMAAEMDEYMKSETLYWPMSRGDMPKLTLGGYLLRQHRLLQLASSLDEADWGRLETAVARFNEALSDKIVRTERRAHEELGVRSRQWGTYLGDVQRQAAQAAVNYGTAVENRAMITALIRFLQTEPYRLEPGVLANVQALDQALRRHWQPGDFVWPQEWVTAYPPDTYWWLYGRPK